jgi:uncharacterized surface protein with fasciclin (FAS1) repeats
VFGATNAVAQERDWDQEQPQEQPTQEMQQVDGQDLTATAEGIQEISLFVQALRQTGLAEAIQMEGPYTIFAPTNEAIENHFSDDDLERMGLKVKDDERAEREYDPAMDREERDDEWQEEDRPAWDEDQEARDRDKQQRQVQQAQLSPEDREELTRFVRAHIVMGQLTADQLGTTPEVQNVLGQNLEVEVDEDKRREARERDLERVDREGQEWEAEHAREDLEETGVEIDNVDIVRADVRAANGILHVIDGVIEPAEAEEIREEREQEWEDRDDRDWQDDDPFEDDDPFDDQYEDDRPAQ